MGVDVFGHTLSFMPDNFLDESLVNFLFSEERDAGVSCIMRAVSVIDRLLEQYRHIRHVPAKGQALCEC